METPPGPAQEEQRQPEAAPPAAVQPPPHRLRHFRHFTAHPTYQRMAPMLSFLRRFGPLLTTLSLLVTSVSVIITGIGVKQSRDIYLRSLQPVLYVQLADPSKQQSRQILINNPSGADAHDVHIGCRRVPSWTSIYATVSIEKHQAAQEISRNTMGVSMPIDTNCPEFDAGPQLPGALNTDVTVLPFFVCYRDERRHQHAIVRLFQYKTSQQGFSIMPLDSPFGRQVSQQAKQQCGVEPESA
jgi:hypothetical protein